jgi:hypothetical protein
MLLLTVTMGGVPQKATAADEDPWQWSWYRVDDKGKVTIHLYVFWSRTCPRCEKATPFVEDLRTRYPWLRVYWYEISSHPPNRELYRRMAESLGQFAGQVPAFFYCKQAQIGFDSSETSQKKIDQALVRCHKALEEHYRKRSQMPTVSEMVMIASAIQGLENDSREPLVEPPDLPMDVQPENDSLIELPLLGTIDPASVSLPVLTMVLAGCDAFNPCAFFVLLFLLSMMVHTHSRLRMLFVGGIFVFFSALIYFLFMAAWLNLFFILGQLTLITLIAGLIAVIISIINIKDYFWFKQGVSLSIPDSVKPDLYRRMTGLIRTGGLVSLVVSTVVLSATVNLYELLCTSGFPLVYTRILTLRELPTVAYYFYLLLYNLVYVLPLALIVLAFVVTLGTRKLSEYEGRVLKLLSGVMMLVLGILLLVKPEWLNTLVGAVLTLGSAMGLTIVVVAIDWVRQARSSERKDPTLVIPAHQSATPRAPA